MREVKIGTANYTTVYATDVPALNANHSYRVTTIHPDHNTEMEVARILFQKGPIKESGVNGCHHEDLLAIVIDRLQNFQDSDYKCRENAIAITKLEEAMMWLNKRTQDRVNRGVEGTSTI